MPDEEKLRAVRDLLPATAAGIYLNTADAGPLPAETALAMTEAADWELRTGRAHPAHLEEREVRLDEARASLAAILHADIDAVAITHSAADGLAALVDGRAGRRIAVSDDLEPAVRDRLLAAAAAAGIAADPVAERAIPPGVQRVFVPHVTADGDVLPIAELARDAAAAGAELVVDGSLAAGAVPVDVDALGVAAYATDAHRWLLGPAGMGGLFVRGADAAPVRAALEATQFHGPSVVGMARSAGWLAMYVGLDWVSERTRTLTRRLALRLATIDHVEVRTPQPPMAGIVVFRLTRWPDDDAHEELGRRAFAILGRVPGGIRASIGAFNTDADLDRFVDSVELLASHTPETLPRRPNLTILHESGG